MILASKETYDLFFERLRPRLLRRRRRIMDSIFNRGYACPNASWNGTFISFCPGLTTDDVTGHEWGHAYTQYTHDLIYQWQPGALNESYSDIFGETIDRINGRGGDTPDDPRTADALLGVLAALRLRRWPSPAAAPPARYLSQASVNEPPRPVHASDPPPMALAVPAERLQRRHRRLPARSRSSTGRSLPTAPTSAAPARAPRTPSTPARPASSSSRRPAGLLNLGSIAAIASVQVTNADGNDHQGRPAGQRDDRRWASAPTTRVRWLLGEDDTAAGLTGRAARHVEPALLRQPRQGVGHVRVRLLDG